jgi:hypothetical protein
MQNNELASLASGTFAPLTSLTSLYVPAQSYAACVIKHDARVGIWPQT